MEILSLLTYCKDYFDLLTYLYASQNCKRMWRVGHNTQLRLLCCSHNTHAQSGSHCACSPLSVMVVDVQWTDVQWTWMDIFDQSSMSGVHTGRVWPCIRWAACLFMRLLRAADWLPGSCCSASLICWVVIVRAFVICLSTIASVLFRCLIRRLIEQCMCASKQLYNCIWYNTLYWSLIQYNIMVLIP